MREIPFEQRLRQELLVAIGRRKGHPLSAISRLAIAGGAAAIIALVGIAVIASNLGDSERRRPRLNAPAIDIQKEGPLGGGEKVTLDEVMRRTPYRLPAPPTNDDTGALSGIWMTGGGCEGSECSSPQVGFVWATDMRFYVNASDTSEEIAVAQWERKAANEEDAVLLTVRGHIAIGRERDENGPSALTWMEQGLSLQFVSPDHALEELKAFAEAITYEE